jgi:hypothetical protein
VTFYFHLVKNEAIQIQKREIEANRKQRVGIVVEISILAGRHAIVPQNLEAPYTNQERHGHVKVQEDVPPDGVALGGTHYHSALKKSAD